MLMRFDPFRELERIAGSAFGTADRPSLMPMDAYRDGDRFIVRFDLPGVEPSSIDLTVDHNVLTVTAERKWDLPEAKHVIAAERPQGWFSRQLFLGESVDADHIDASYDNGVLTVVVPVAEQAKPRKVQIGGASGSDSTKTLETSSSGS